MPSPTHRLPKEPRITRHLDLLLENAKVLTLEPDQPRAEAVGVRAGAIVAVGRRADMAHLTGPDTRTIDCQGMTLLPGFVDAHCHLLATAAALQGLDCSPQAVSTIADLQRVIRQQVEATPQERWVRGFGYDDVALKERRHPTRWELDSAAPSHPVRLEHRTGHATVMNSRGLYLAGIHRDTPDPVDGVIDRDEATGEPSGLLLEMSGFLQDRLGRLKTDSDFEEGISRLDQMLLSYGITSVQDAGPKNNLARWESIGRLQASGRLSCRVTMMAGAPHLNEFLTHGCIYNDGDQQLRLGHAKVMLTLTTGTLQPDIQTLRQIVKRAHGAGFPVALHAVEQEAVAAAARLLQENPFEPTFKKKRRHSPPFNREPPLAPPLEGEAKEGRAGGGRLGRSIPGDRIEHCAECPAPLADQIGLSRATVVTQPGFIFWNGDHYREMVDPSLLGCLYPVDALVRSGVNVAFGSDAPVIDPNPWPAIYSVVTRATRSGEVLYPDGPAAAQKVSVESALRMYTVAGARAEGSQSLKGTIRRGKLADLVLVDKDPTKLEPSSLKDIRPVLTVLGGKVVWGQTG